MFKNFFLFLLLLSTTFLQAQIKPEKKYPSLLWEITGNGLKKPSYLFGTMHVSNKLVFHLSDSFFYAIKKSDVVGLELNSDTWQQEMIAMEKQKESFYKFYGNNNTQYGNGVMDYNNQNTGIKDYTFKLENNYISTIQYALQETPYIINSLLYRSKDYKQDFEENTFLDMYIYQTGKKLGKKSAGMETIFTMEKYTTEAEIDQANEKIKKKKKFNYDEMPEMTGDEAYRKGDLDMLDSLDRMNIESEAFIEKFLYQRNDVQANSMDTIMKKGLSLFVGVGAAHLPGKRGVIEILRKMGYNMRPIKMLDRDATNRDAIDKIKVPVKFIENIAADNFYKVNVPGKLYSRSDAPMGISAQYADMSNGAYYMVTRVPTLSNYFNIDDATVLQKIDSLLYENIPGKILKKIKIIKNGYSGFDITNKTRRGDLQRYNIFVTPNEVVFFKMSANENYVDGEEAKEFFGSIKLLEAKTNWRTYTNKLSNFSCYLPQEPYTKLFNGNAISVSSDKEKKINYLIQKRILKSSTFEIVDTFNIMLSEESFIGSSKGLKILNRTFATQNGTTTMVANYNIADTFIQAKYIVKGIDLYLVLARGNNKNAVQENLVIPSFKILTYPQYAAQLYVDTFLKFTVKTPYVPIVADSIKSLLYKVSNIDKYNYGNKELEYKSWGNYKSMTFYNDTTSEVVKVGFSQEAKYFYVADSIARDRVLIDSMSKVLNNAEKLAKYAVSLDQKHYPEWHKNHKKKAFEKDEIFVKNGFIIRKKSEADSGSTKMVRSMEFAKDNYVFDLFSIVDTANNSKFVNDFFDSFMPLDNIKSQSILKNKIDDFFIDYYSADTAIKKIARSAMTHIPFEKKNLPKMLEAFHKISIKDKDYFDTKNKWISEIASIPDTSLNNDKFIFLKDVYEKSMDSTIFQNNVLNQLVTLKTLASYKLFKQYIIQDPPIIDNDYEYGDYAKASFFTQMDSLSLANTLFPDLLQLISIDDYKNDITNLLIKLVDSNKITSKEYESYSGKILFDAKLAYKKKLVANEKLVKDELEKEDVSGESDQLTYAVPSRSNGANDMMDYVKLLMPFYNENAAVPNFINKLWKLNDDILKYDLLYTMIDKGKYYPDTMINYFAKKEFYLGDVYYKLDKMKKLHLFPAAYLKQDIMAKAFLYTSIDKDDQLDSTDKINEELEYNNYDEDDYRDNYGSSNDYSKKMDSISFIKKEIVTINKKVGYIYIYKYKKEKEDKWRLAISGLQPKDGVSISYKNYVTVLLEDKINEDEQLEDQIQYQLKKIRFNKNPNSESFFTNYNKYNSKQYQY
jgi:uncharacterized protein YbaP (TraB family)